MESMFRYYIVKERMFRTYVRGDYMIKCRYRIVDRKRFNMFIIFTTIIITFIISLFINNNKAYSFTYNEPFKKVVISKGDTIWSIALENMPDGYDVRKMVYEIREFNNLDDAIIHPGDVIKIPIKH